MLVSIDNIITRSRKYEPTKQERERLQLLIFSIEEKGLLEPISVIKTSDCYYLFDGQLRLEAYVKLHRKKIPVQIINKEGI
jgi:ParB-like chromosome segregation protein Spo0J